MFRLLFLFSFASLLLGCTQPEPQTQLQTQTPERILNVGFVVVNGVYNTELTAPMDIFQHTVFRTDSNYMQVFTVAPDSNIITSFEGLQIIPDYTFANCPNIDVLVVPSAEHSMDTDLENEELINFVKVRSTTARYIMSLCDGAFVLAQAGLLNGANCTTFPADIDALQERFPKTITHKGVSFVHDGKRITSNGGARSFDCALYLVELLYGKQAAVLTAQGMCIDWDLASIKHL